MIKGFVWFVILLASTPEGVATPDSGVKVSRTLDACMSRSQEFAMKHKVPIQICTKISEEGYRIIAAYETTFDNDTSRQYTIVEPAVDPEVVRLRKALREIGKWHQGKTKDSQRVRAIIAKVIKGAKQ